MADDPRSKLLGALAGNTGTPKAPEAPKSLTTPKAPKAPDYEPLPIQPDEHSEYMGKALSRISKRINTKGQELMKNRLLKTSSSKSSGSKS